MATNDKVYTASTAQITADRGNPMAADIMETAEHYVGKMRVIRDNMRTEYWELHAEIAKHEFPAGFHEQSAAVAKLGHFAIALKKIDEAYSAISLVRCFD